MSLKAFHIFFIAVSTLLAFGLGVWGVSGYLAGGGTSPLIWGLLAAMTGLVLVVYGLYFLQKLKQVK